MFGEVVVMFGGRASWGVEGVCGLVYVGGSREGHR